jgi:sugar phosphate isomerase/epimerase
MAGREFSLEHLTLLDVAPPDLVTLAAEAGFDSVSLRISPATPGEQPWPITLGSPMLADTISRARGTGIRVLGAEAIRLDSGGPGGWEPILETAAQLGARYVNAMSGSGDLSRLSDRFGELTRMAAPYGIRPVIEFMAYQPVRTLGAALDIAARSGGGGVLVDALHVQRCGVDLGQLSRADPALLSYVQLCDAPLKPPAGLRRPASLPRSQPAGDDDQALEARTSRLLPGEGELPLTGLLSALPAHLPVGVEAPSLALSQELTPRQLAERARHAAQRVLAMTVPP